jgi:hypothetical protein
LKVFQGVTNCEGENLIIQLLLFIKTFNSIQFYNSRKITLNNNTIFHQSFSQQKKILFNFLKSPAGTMSLKTHQKATKIFMNYILYIWEIVWNGGFLKLQVEPHKTVIKIEKLKTYKESFQKDQIYFFCSFKKGCNLLKFESKLKKETLVWIKIMLNKICIVCCPFLGLIFEKLQFLWFFREHEFFSWMIES